MKVIVAGYPKTGTKSLNAALSLLGYKCYDFMEHWWYHGEHWMEIFNNNAKPEIFSEMYKDVDAVMDVPAFFYWEEIHKMFPDAKIILSVRDEDSWYPSYIRQRKADVTGFKRQILFLAASTRFNPLKIYKLLQYFSSMVRVTLGSTFGINRSEMTARMLYRRHYAYALKAAPKDKLLVYNIADGWDPLCEFLQKDKPDVPFPHKNKKATIADEMIAENRIAIENLRITKRRFLLIGLIFAGLITAYIFT